MTLQATCEEEEVRFRSTDDTALRGTLRAAPHPRRGCCSSTGLRPTGTRTGSILGDINF